MSDDGGPPAARRPAARVKERRRHPDQPLTRPGPQERPWPRIKLAAVVKHQPGAIVARGRSWRA